MNENKIYDILKSETEKTDIPESLRPENMIDKLGDQIVSLSQASADVIDANRELQKADIIKKPKSKVKRFIAVAGGIAAAVVAIILGVSVRNIYLEHRGSIGLFETASNGVFKNLSSYEQLAEYIEVQNNKIDFDLDFNLGFIMTSKDAAPESIKGMTTKGDIALGVSDNSSKGSYSDTNVRTEGVLEADCVKTDGEYIFTIVPSDYIYNEDNEGNREGIYLDIAKAMGEKTEYIAHYNLSDMIGKKLETDIGSYGMPEMLIYEEKIIYVGNMSLEKNDYLGCTVVAVFDRTDVNDIKLLQCFTVSGNYAQCRMNSGYLYVISNYGIALNRIEPQINDEDMNCKDVYMSDVEDYHEYMIFTSYDMNGEAEMIDNCAIVNDGQPELYASAGNFYLISSTYEDTLFNDEKRMLCIMKLSYGEGKLEPKANVMIDGWLEDVFCVDEYDNYLRIVVTSFKNDNEINTLHVFDDSLKEVGKIEDIAPGENIYSARFDGDIGYFVTFRQMDPLFSVDLSDPENPKIIGELKIPGFSEYMHMWSEDKMFGIGQENGYIKLSMFNILDPKNVTEEDKVIIEDIFYSDALYNHKAILVDGDKNIIGFCAEGVKYNLLYNEVDTEVISGYYIYTYEDGKFVKKLMIDVGGKVYGGEDVRGMYIGDYIYIVSTCGVINVVSMENYEIVKTVQHFY